MDRRSALLALAAMAGTRRVSAQAPGRGGPGPAPPPADRIRVRFFRIIYERFDQANAEVTADAHRQLDAVVTEGAERVEKEKSPDAYARGDDGFRIFVDRLVAAGREAANRVRITGEVVSSVRKAVCPLFPFC